MKIGPFFYIHNKLIYDACLLEQGRHQADKIDNSYGHNQLFDDYFKAGDYIDYPRGRVVWDVEQEHSIIYIDPCINSDSVLTEVIAAFDIDEYIVALDDHYHCRNCVKAIFDDFNIIN